MFDKTGTLTIGKPVITDLVTNNEEESKFSKNLVIQYFVALESKSNHPLSQAILDYGEINNVEQENEVINFRNIPGKGIDGKIDGKTIFIGSLKSLKEKEIDLSSLENDINRLQSEGKTLLLMTIDDQLIAIAAAEDQIKPSSYETVRLLHEMGLKVGMISGDNKKTAQKVADAIGIDIVFAEVLPNEKADHIKSLQNQGNKVAMVGDGVNDAPALAQADIGIAIGAGTDVAVETANIILMKSDPLDVVTSIFLSNSTVTKMKQNLLWASVYNIIAIPIAAGLLYPITGLVLRPEFSALLMSLSSIIVATNAVLLKKAEKKIIEFKQAIPSSN
ncbi:MAG: HAD-IC family P-type ATPase, partial [Candidatus Hodarchaeales archaeon]|jgi:P-type E1-E2 ATPase